MAFVTLRGSAFVFSFVIGSLALPGSSLDASEKGVTHSVKPAFGYHETRHAPKKVRTRLNGPKLRIDEPAPVGVVLISADFQDEDTDEDEPTNSFLREKYSAEPSRGPAKIIRVTEEQYDIGEARAARREAKLLRNIDKIEFRYYRPNEAYDVRFPSIVYLDTIKK